MRRRTRPAFTLFQLLIILAALLILLALLLPAIQKVRQAAARMQSTNNLKQLALAMHNYHDANGAIPAGVNDKHYSALFQLLPYVEQDNVFRKTDTAKDADDKDNAAIRALRIKLFMSPLDAVEAPNPNWGPTNYMGSAGTNESLDGNDGIFYKDSAVKIPGDITDGTSNTLAFIETLKGNGGKQARTVARQHVRLGKKELAGLMAESGVKEFKANKHIPGDRGASWIDGRFLQATINGTRKLNDSRPDVDCGGEGGLAAARTAIGVVQVGLCDGSVRSVSTAVSLETWKAACTRAGGEVLGADW
jgi:type II secretory pathway pseudopilin PulG